MLKLAYTNMVTHISHILRLKASARIRLACATCCS